MYALRALFSVSIASTLKNSAKVFQAIEFHQLLFARSSKLSIGITKGKLFVLAVTTTVSTATAFGWFEFTRLVHSRIVLSLVLKKYGTGRHNVRCLG